MLRTVNIKNYRCFKELTIESLGRVNLVAGKNNVGKTSLLEAMYLLLARGLPDWPLKMEVVRGFESLIPKSDVETVWGWLFHGKSIDQDIELSCVAEDGTVRSLSIKWEAWRDTEVRFDQQGGASSRHPGLLLFSYTDSTGEKVKVSIHEKGMSRDDQQPKSAPVGVLLGGSTRSPEDDARLFSELMAVSRHNAVLDTLKILEPRLTQLSVLYLSGVPMIYGEIGLGQFVPLPQMGDGLTRILSLVLEIARSPHSLMLVDEIEHGLHHSVMVKVWQAIMKAATTNDTQIVATTHSWECIQAAHEAFTAPGASDFRLHRLERVKGEVRAVTYDQESLGTSVEMNLEVR